MIVQRILYTNTFVKQLKNLPTDIQSVAFKKEDIFKLNPLHPSLRIHPLKGKLLGLWSISLTKNYRIIFERIANGDILFHSIGTHDVYKSL